MQGPSLHPACRVCSVCGYYVEQAHFSKEPTFTKGAAGESAVAGQYVSDSQNGVRLANGRVYGGVRGWTLLAQLCFGCSCLCMAHVRSCSCKQP